MSHILNYQPKKYSRVNLQILSQLTEYRDYKFSNGFWHLDQNEIRTLVSNMSSYDFELLLDQIFSASPVLYDLFKKILMNESTVNEYHQYCVELENAGVMDYNYKQLYRC
jgi:hypothetical protein